MGKTPNVFQLIFQQSLGGNARTTVIVCVSPAKYNNEETISTLNFGIRAKTIKNVVKANVEVSAAEWRNRSDNFIELFTFPTTNIFNFHKRVSL